LLYNISLASAIHPHEPATGTRMSPLLGRPPPPPCCRRPPVLCRGSSLAVYTWPCTYVSAALSVHPALSFSTSYFLALWILVLRIIQRSTIFNGLDPRISSSWCPEDTSLQFACLKLSESKCLIKLDALLQPSLGLKMPRLQGGGF